MSDPRDEAPADTRHQPYDIDIEQAVLGSMLRDNRQIDAAAAEIAEHHFHDPLHGRIFEMIVHLQTEVDTVTPMVLHAAMKSDAGVIETGGQAYFDALRNAAPATVSIRDNVRILLELSMRRELLAIAEEITADAYAPPSERSAQSIADRATEAMLQAGRATSEKDMTPYEVGLETLAEVEKMRRGEWVPSIPMGLEKVDEELGGLRGGDFVVLLGKSGMGKSALMGGTSLNTARAGIPTLVFTLEMRRQQWVQRLVTDIDYDTAMAEGQKAMWYSRVRNGKLSNEEFDRFYLANMKLQNLPLEIVESDDLTVQQIQSRARAFAAKYAKNEDGSPRLGIVIVDYVQIIEPTDPRDNRERQVAKIARGLKSLAKRLNWVVMAGSQMNESDAGRSKEEKRPQASDARESKAIQHEADIIFAPFRPAYFVENQKPMDAIKGDPAYTKWLGDLKLVRHKFELLMLKNRHGRRLDFDLHCDMGASAIRDFAPRGALTQPEQDAGDLLKGVT